MPYFKNGKFFQSLGGNRPRQAIPLDAKGIISAPGPYGHRPYERQGGWFNCNFKFLGEQPFMLLQESLLAYEPGDKNELSLGTKQVQSLEIPKSEYRNPGVVNRVSGE